MTRQLVSFRKLGAPEGRLDRTGPWGRFPQGWAVRRRARRARLTYPSGCATFGSSPVALGILPGR